MRSLVAVCDAHLVRLEEERRKELQILRRRARYERYRHKCNQKIENCEKDLAVSVSYDGSRLDVRVQNPLTVLPTEGGRYTTYEIAISTNNIAFTLPKSYVRRRYSEFTWFRSQLAHDHADIVPPTLPPKTWWGGQFDPPVIEQRLRGLRSFLQGVLLERVYLSNRALHLFVQTDLSTRDIENVLNGKDKTPVPELILEAAANCMTANRCDTCLKETDADNSSCGSCDSEENAQDETDAAITIHITGNQSLPQPVSKGDSHLTDLSGDGQTPNVPLMSSTPHRSLSDSALVLNDSHELSNSSESESSSSEFSQLKDDSDCESQGSSSSLPGATKKKADPLKSVLSQSLPTGRGRFMKCSHRKRRVTFSMEVTVAKVVEKSEGEEEDVGQNVALVKVDKNKDRTKGH